MKKIKNMLIKMIYFSLYDDTTDKLLLDCLDEVLTDEDLSTYFNI